MEKMELLHMCSITRKMKYQRTNAGSGQEKNKLTITWENMGANSK
jgi:hypothetical protein